MTRLSCLCQIWTMLVWEAGTEVEDQGLSIEILRSKLSKQLIMPSYPASRALCNGGIVNNNSKGFSWKNINILARISFPDGKISFLVIIWVVATHNSKLISKIKLS